MADAFCIVCGAGMTGDEAALNYKYISRQCRDFLCPACLGKKLGLSPDELHRMIQVFRAQAKRLYSLPHSSTTIWKNIRKRPKQLLTR